MIRRLNPAFSQACLAAFLIPFTIGCGGGGPAPLPKYPVTGAVSLGGKPVGKGQIRFVPGPGEKLVDPDVAPIVDGSYSAQVAAGKKTVEITSLEATGPVFDGKPTDQNVAPAKYNTKSELAAEIKAGSNQGVDFKLD